MTTPNTGDTMWKRQRRLINAATLVGETCGEALASVAGSFTCTEAEAIAALLNECNSAFAPDFQRIHAKGDDDESDQHRNGWE